MFYSAEVKTCPLKTLRQQHQCDGVISSKDLDLGGKLQQPEKWKSLKEQEKKQGYRIIFELLTLEKNIAFQSPLCLIVTRHCQSMLLFVVLQWHQKFNSCWFGWKYRQVQHYIDFDSHTRWKILPFRIIYGGKTDQSVPKITFPAQFSTSVGEKHYSNTQEVIIHLQEIVIPYVNEERKKMEVLINMHYSYGTISWPGNRSDNFFTIRAKDIE